MKWLFSICVFLLLPFLIFAAEDVFTVAVNISNDITPPSIPSPITATPVATTQIDVTWGASTDNDVLAGYKLFRDAIQIATTTLTNYSDTSLTPSTTYSYYVQAYDMTGNVSTSSVTVATTTLAVTPPATTTPTTTTQTTRTQSGGMQPRILTIDISPTNTTAEIEFISNSYIQYVLRWGRGSTYELGSVQNQIYRKSHRTVITDLEPGTAYSYQIIGITKYGREVELRTGMFTTLGYTSTQPVNVRNFTLIPSVQGVQLNWEYPVGVDTTKVRIVRNYRFYPLDPAAGYIVYEGSATGFFDTTAWVNTQQQFYTIFTYDSDGRVSSGVVGVVQKPSGSRTSSTDVDTVGADDAYDDSYSPTTTSPIGEWESGLEFTDFEFSQHSTLLQINDDKVIVLDNDSVLVSLPVGRVTTDLKSILLKMTTSASTHTYLLRLNAEGTAYEAVIPAPPVGVHNIIITLHNYVYGIRHTVMGELKSVAAPATADRPLWFLLWWVPLVVLVSTLLLRRWLR